MIDRQRPLHDRRHRRQEGDPVVGDQPEELLRLEPAHQHQVVAHQQRDGRGGEAGVVRQRDRHKRGVALLRAQRIADGGRYPAVAAGFDELGPARAAARSHCFPDRRHRFRQRRIGQLGSGSGTETRGRHAWYFRWDRLRAPPARPAAAIPAGPPARRPAAVRTAAGAPRPASSRPPRPGSTRSSWAAPWSRSRRRRRRARRRRGPAGSSSGRVRRGSGCARRS